MTAFYNEREPYAAAWLRNLIDAGHIAPGVVDERDIRDIRPDELTGFTQCHFFAGIGVWSHALRSAGWPDDRPIWTGSCPCQPFSAAGQRAGEADERHLWPHWHWLIAQCHPPVVLGEQVASKDGLGWLDLVSADLEGTGYAVGASDLCAAGFGGAHIRQRLYFVGLADAERQQRERRRADTAGDEPGAIERTERLCDASRLADALPAGRPERRPVAGHGQVAGGGVAGRLGHGLDPQLEGHGGDGDDRDQSRRLGADPARPVAEAGAVGGMVDTDRPHAPMLGRHPADWLFCRDGLWRPVEPGTFPLAHAAPARVGRLRAYGNALDAETATGFVVGVMLAIEEAVLWKAPEQRGQLDLFGAAA